jgi:hypothetical protein
MVYIIEFDIFLEKGYILAKKIRKSKNSVINILRKVDNFIYEFGDKIL